MTISTSEEVKALGELIERFNAARLPILQDGPVTIDGPTTFDMVIDYGERKKLRDQLSISVSEGFLLIDALTALEIEREGMREALAFYADPESYHAVSFWFDPPCGDFIDDFEEPEDHQHPDYSRAMPGKRAREVMMRQALASITTPDIEG